MNEKTTIGLTMKEMFDNIENLLDDSKRDEALELNIRLYEEALANDDTYAIANCLYYFGYIEEIKSEPQKALAFYKKATAICRRYNYSKCLVRTLNNRGNIYVVVGKLHSAISKYSEALQIVRREKNHKDYYMKLLNNLALIYMDINDYDQALEYLYESIENSKEIDNKIVLTTIYSNLADIYMIQKNILKSRYYNRLSNEISTDIDDEIGIALCLANEGIYEYAESGEFDKSAKLFEDSLNILGDLSEVDREEIVLKYGKLAYEANIYEEAKVILGDLAREAKENTYFKNEVKALEILKKIYEFEGLYKEALEAANRILEIKDGNLERFEESYLETVDGHSGGSGKGSSVALDVDSMQKSIKTLKLLSEVGQKITACKTENEIYKVLLEELANIIGYDAFGVGIMAKNNVKIDYKFYDDDGFNQYDISVYDDDFLMATCIKFGKDIIVYDTKDNAYNEANFEGKLLYKIKHSDTRGILFTPIRYGEEIIGGLTIQTYERGKLSYVDLESLKVLGSYIAIAYSNIKRARELEKVNKKLEEVSLLDGLTGVYNRHALGQYIGKEFIGMLEKKLPACALMIDIDYFKQFNDNYGHIKGDHCLKKVCVALKNSLSYESFRLFRYGGDEFFVVIEGCNEEKAVQILEDIMLEIRKLSIAHQYSKVSDFVTLTIGATIIKSPIKDYTIVFNNSDEALYEAKENGRNQYSINIT